MNRNAQKNSTCSRTTRKSHKNSRYRLSQKRKDFKIKIFSILLGLGFFIMLGTAGASDFGNITMARCFVQLLISAVFMLSGYAGLRGAGI